MYTIKLILLVCSFAAGAMGHTVMSLDSDLSIMFHMTSIPDRIEIQVTAATTGWVAFGFSRTNSFANADMVIGYVNGNEIYHRVSTYYTSIIPAYQCNFRD